MLCRNAKGSVGDGGAPWLRSPAAYAAAVPVFIASRTNRGQRHGQDQGQGQVQGSPIRRGSARVPGLRAAGAPDGRGIA